MTNPKHVLQQFRAAFGPMEGPEKHTTKLDIQWYNPNLELGGMRNLSITTYDENGSYRIDLPVTQLQLEDLIQNLILVRAILNGEF